MKKELIWPVTIILASVIIGGSMLLVQANKQESIERQKREEIALENEKAKEAARKEASDKMLLSLCLDDARTTAWEFVKLNGTKVPGKEDVYNAPAWVWNDHDDKKKAGEDLCFKKYR